MALSAGLRTILFGRPAWVPQGAAVVMDFANSRYWGGSLSSLLSISRASRGWATTKSGLVVPFAANQLRITDQGLLIEEARTNLTIQSANFANAAWAASNLGAAASVPTVTNNFAVAPDGTTTAARLQMSLGGGTTTGDRSQIGQAVTIVAGSTYANSIWIRSTDGFSSYQISLALGAGSTPARASLSVGPAWTRISSPFATPSTTGGNFIISLVGAQTPTNSDTADILIWGGQLELGSFPTSYIPTTTVAVARAADNVSVIGPLLALVKSVNALTRFGKAIGVAVSGAARLGLSFNGAATLSFQQSSTQSGIYNGSVATVATLGSGNYQSIKTVGSYDSSGDSIVANGGTEATSVNVFAKPTAATLGSDNGSSQYLNGYLAIEAIWAYRLPSSTRQNLSTP